MPRAKRHKTFPSQTSGRQPVGAQVGSVHLLGPRSRATFPEGQLVTCVQGGGAVVAEAPKAGLAGLATTDLGQKIPASSQSPAGDPLPAGTAGVLTTAIRLLCARQGVEILYMHYLVHCHNKPMPLVSDAGTGEKSGGRTGAGHVIPKWHPGTSTLGSQGPGAWAPTEVAPLLVPTEASPALPLKNDWK